MPIFIRLRRSAVKLARALRRSILTETTLWEIGVDDEGSPSLSAGPFRVVAVPRAVRVLDALHLYCGGTEIWLPLVSRLRLRNAMRLVLVEHALEFVDLAESEPVGRPTKKGRRPRREHVA